MAKNKPDYLPKDLGKLAEGWYRCTICTHTYPEKDIVIDAETKLLICKNCAVNKKELDQEQKDIANCMTEEEWGELREDEIKVKAGYLDKEGP